MRLLTACLICVFALVFNANGQIVNAGITASEVHVPITRYISYLRSETQLPIDSVLLYHNKFENPSEKPVMIMNYDPYYYWFRIIVQNDEPLPRPLMLLMAPVGLYDGRLYQKNNGRWTEVAHSGLKYPFKERSYQFTHYVFPFTLKQTSLDTLYLNVDASNVYKSFGFALLQPRDLKLFENRIYFVFGIIVGLLLLFFVLNISLFFALKQRMHLWYAGYIVLLFLVVMKNDHLDQQFLGLDSERAFRLTPYMSIGALALAILMHVVQEFLNGALKHNRWLYRVSDVLKVNVLASAAVHAVIFNMVEDYRVQNIVFSWAKLSTLLVICMIIIDCLYCIRRFRPALFILLGTSVFMIGSVQRLFFPITLSFLFPPTTFHIGIILEIFVVSLGLIYRYWSEKVLLRKTEERVQIEVTRHISAEIHDTVGQDLALAGLYLKTLNYDSRQEMLDRVGLAKQTILKAGKDLRELVRAIKEEPASAMEMLSLVKAECDNLRDAGEFSVEMQVSGEMVTLNNYIQGMIIRIIKGALQNIIHHAAASKVTISLVYSAQQLAINICDNGIGFDTCTTGFDSNGLNNIRNRCALINATCEINSLPGNGTAIIVCVPIG